MIPKCERCGADLTVPSDPSVLRVTCRYCNADQLVPDHAERRRYLEQLQEQQRRQQQYAPPPPSWAQPPQPQWGQPSFSNEPFNVGGAVATGVRVAVLVPIMMTLVGLAFAAYMVARTNGGFGMFGLSWDGHSTLVCTGNDHGSFSGLVVDLPGQAAVNASGNCQVTLTNCNIRATTAFLLSGNARITVIGGQVTSDVVMAGSGNSAVDFGNTAVTGRVLTSGNAHVTGIPSQGY